MTSVWIRISYEGYLNAEQIHNIYDLSEEVKATVLLLSEFKVTICKTLKTKKNVDCSKHII